MQTVLPYTVNPEQMTACERLKLVNPNSTATTGPFVNTRKNKLVVGGLLHNWDRDAAQSFLGAPRRVQTWDLLWGESESYWEENVSRCVGPEEVEDLLPAKWIGYRLHSDVDETLARVCKLCTALVDRFVHLSQGGNASGSTTRWRQHQALYERLGSVMELLEASIGEAVPILRLKDPEFLRRCWGELEEEERMEIVSALGSEQNSDFY